MRLDRVESQQVVRHIGNGSFYRVEGPERGRIRIYSLELFPTGLLIPKSTPTLVAGDMGVELVGPWVDGMVAEGRPRHTRRWYERELEKLRAELVVLEAQYEALPAGGKGKQSRGSHANKVKGVRHHIETIERGLSFQPEPEQIPAEVAVAQKAPLGFQAGDLVQLPSGLPALVNTATAGVVAVHTRFRGGTVHGELSPDVLRPWSQARACTI